MSEWTTVKLGEISTFIRGITFKPADLVEPGPDTVECYRTKNIQSSLMSDDLWAIPTRFVKREDQYLREGDVLISSANSWNLVGKCSWVPAAAMGSTFGGFVTVLRATSNRVDARYLYHWFNSPRIQATVRSFGNKTTSISNLNLKRTGALEFPLPPLPEQRRIADILDRADALTQTAAISLEQSKHLADALFISMFGAPAHPKEGYTSVRLLDRVKLRSGSTPSKSNKDYWGGNVPWFSPKDLKASELEDSIDWVTATAVADKKATLHPKDSVAFVTRGMILAHTFPVSLLRVAATANQDLKIIQPTQGIAPEFLLANLRAQSSRVLDRVETSAHGTKRLPMEVLGDLRLVDATEEQQSEFVAAYNAATKHVSVLERQQVITAALFSSLQSRAFRGEL